MSRARAAVWRFLTDYRNWFTLIAAVLTALLVAFVVDAISSRHAAINALTTQAVQAKSAQQAASRRIDQFRREIAALQSQHVTDVRDGARRDDELAVLAEQLRRLGAAPIVKVTVTTAAGSPGASPRPPGGPTPHTTATPTPRPSPSPSPTCTRPLGLLC